MIALAPAAALALLVQAPAPADAPATAAPVSAATEPIPPGTNRVARRARTPGDPAEKFNRRMFAIHQGIDRAVLRPAALGYRHVVPKPVRTGLRHFFSNLGEPIVFLNYLLQLKPGKAIETAARFAVNSTVGLAGVIDVARAKPIRLPHRPNGFGDTLGFYGIKPGPYLFLPLIGPTDLRDLVGGQADGLVLPLAVGGELKRSRFEIPRAVLAGLDLREQSRRRPAGAARRRGRSLCDAALGLPPGPRRRDRRAARGEGGRARRPAGRSASAIPPARCPRPPPRRSWPIRSPTPPRLSARAAPTRPADSAS